MCDLVNEAEPSFLAQKRTGHKQTLFFGAVLLFCIRLIDFTLPFTKPAKTGAPRWFQRPRLRTHVVGGTIRKIAHVAHEPHSAVLLRCCPLRQHGTLPVTELGPRPHFQCHVAAGLVLFSCPVYTAPDLAHAPWA